MNAKFSFYYGEKRYDFFAKNGEEYELEKGITVKAEVKEYKDYDATEWVLYFENKTCSNSNIFSDISDCDTLLPLVMPDAPKSMHIPDRGDTCVISMTGTKDWWYYERNAEVSASEFSFNRHFLDKQAPDSKIGFGNKGGRSSDEIMPFFDVTANGNGYITAIGWTGDWKAEFCKTENGIQMKSGLKETKFYLKPDETIRTTSTLVMQYNKAEDKHNKFRKLIKNHYSHKSYTKTKHDGLMAFELWGSLSSEEMKKRIGELSKYKIGFDEIWIDAGWSGSGDTSGSTLESDWSSQVGNWDVNTNIHPDCLRDVSKSVQDAGMRLMLWIEPERAIESTAIVKKHPEWFMKLPNTKDTILNYGNKEALEYVFDLISNYVEDLNLLCYRQDFNVGLTDYFKSEDEENRRGITEIKHITGMYELWERLSEKFPELLIDNCSSGGRRIDIETLKRSILFFRTDYQCMFNTNPEVLQVHNTNISTYLPYTGCTNKTKGDTYAIRSSYSSSWGGAFYNTAFQTMNEEDFLWAKKISDEYKKICKYFSMDFYNHGSCKLDETAWCIWQYHDSETQSGIVMAFRRTDSPFEQINIKLKGTDENKNYVYQNLDSGETTVGHNTLSINLPQKRSSVIFEYKLK